MGRGLWCAADVEGAALPDAVWMFQVSFIFLLVLVRLSLDLEVCNERFGDLTARGSLTTTVLVDSV
jgi:hypothetical protein